MSLVEKKKEKSDSFFFVCLFVRYLFCFFVYRRGKRNLKKKISFLEICIYLLTDCFIDYIIYLSRLIIYLFIYLLLCCLCFCVILVQGGGVSELKGTND